MQDGLFLRQSASQPELEQFQDVGPHPEYGFDGKIDPVYMIDYRDSQKKLRLSKFSFMKKLSEEGVQI